MRRPIVSIVAREEKARVGSRISVKNEGALSIAAAMMAAAQRIEVMMLILFICFFMSGLPFC